jgi:hypothetical protein
MMMMMMSYSSKHVGLYKWNFKINQLHIVLELVTYLSHPKTTACIYVWVFEVYSSYKVRPQNVVSISYFLHMY